MEPSAKATCQFRKEDGELCRRSVKQGEDYCWQHAHSLLSKWKSLTRNQTILFFGTVLGLLLTLASLLWGPLRPAPEKPDIHLVLVYPKAFAIVLYNSSGVLLEKPKYSPGIWNLDQFDDSGNVPTLMIPAFEGDWIRPHESMGPQNVFGTPLVKPAVKPGDRLFGFITVTCPDCLVNREYWVYEVFNEGGWYCELPKGKAILLDKLAAAIPSFRANSTFLDSLECEGDRKTIKVPSENDRELVGFYTHLT